MKLNVSFFITRLNLISMHFMTCHRTTGKWFNWKNNPKYYNHYHYCAIKTSEQITKDQSKQSKY